MNKAGAGLRWVGRGVGRALACGCHSQIKPELSGLAFLPVPVNLPRPGGWREGRGGILTA